MEPVDVDTVEIDASVIGIRTPIKVKTDYRTVRAALVFNRDSLQFEEQSEDQDPIKSFQGTIDTLDNIIEYLKNTLHLNTKQADKLFELDVPNLITFGRLVAAMVLHTDDDGEESEDDQKSDAK